jgi:drug/metabolite transporter (DMT)-like permease
MSAPSLSKNSIGISSALGASFFFSFNDMAIKFLSGDYALHQVVLIRSVIGMVVLLAVIVPLEGGYRILRTNRLFMHLLRGMCVVIANMTFFLALTAMPLADAVAIFFVSPLVITLFSVIFLKETVGPHRWLAVGMGLIGVVVMMRPASSSFQAVALLPLISAVAYASLHVLTRKIGDTEKAGTLTFYTQVTFIFVSVVMGLTTGGGRFAGSGDPSLDFLLRDWVWPATSDYWIFVLIGIASTFGGYFISQAYRMCEAGLAAPFEYVAVVLAIFWGVMVFGEWPDQIAWIGIALIVGGGFYMLWREMVHNASIKKNRIGRFG